MEKGSGNWKNFYVEMDMHGLAIRILDSAVRGKLNQDLDDKRSWNRQTAAVLLEVVLQEKGSKEDRSLSILLSHLQVQVGGTAAPAIGM